MDGTTIEASFWEAADGGSVRCGLCHHRCTIRPGRYGACRVRRNDGGRLVLPFHGAISGVAVDPIEKKPLYHFMPGTEVFSVGYVGCNLRCPFCQNYHISQSSDAVTERTTPAALVAAALRSGCPSIAHTYSEPVVHAEFVIAAMEEARKAGLSNVLVTNGCAEPAAARDLLDRCDAANVDLKAWDTAFYRDELGGDLDTVRAFIARAVSMGVHVEATTLVIPGKNDDDASMEGIAGFLAGLSPELPLHLSAYRPMYRYALPPTPPATLGRLAAVARRSLRHVYVGNVAGERNDTRCASCGAVLVARRGYAVDATGLRGSACASCGARAPFRRNATA